MPTYRDKGIVLRARPLREDDRHYIVFTEGHGKVSLLAKGMRKIRSKMSPHMAAFGVVDLMVARGKRMDRLAGASLMNASRGVMDSLEKTALVQSFMLAVDALTKYELSEFRIFALLSEFMEVIEKSGSTEKDYRNMVFDTAMVKLLDILGLGLEVDVCVSCRQPFGPDGNGLDTMKGGVECAGCRTDYSHPIGGGTVKTLRFMRSEPLRYSLMLRMDETTRRQVAYIVEVLLTSHLEARFDPLRYMNSVRV
ncbi:MAG: DNA repair protein RecO [Patescibacteria group bacterium]|nr:DNA repair protein RecO [Patescibacteria group bacterium]